MEKTQEINLAKNIAAPNSHALMNAKHEVNDSTPVNYEEPHSSTPNPIYYCVIA